MTFEEYITENHCETAADQFEKLAAAIDKEASGTRDIPLALRLASGALGGSVRGGAIGAGAGALAGGVESGGDINAIGGGALRGAGGGALGGMVGGVGVGALGGRSRSGFYAAQGLGDVASAFGGVLGGLDAAKDQKKQKTAGSMATSLEEGLGRVERLKFGASPVSDRVLQEPPVSKNPTLTRDDFPIVSGVDLGRVVVGNPDGDPDKHVKLGFRQVIQKLAADNQLRTMEDWNTKTAERDEYVDRVGREGFRYGAEVGLPIGGILGGAGGAALAGHYGGSPRAMLGGTVAGSALGALAGAGGVGAAYRALLRNRAEKHTPEQRARVEGRASGKAKGVPIKDGVPVRWPKKERKSFELLSSPGKMALIGGTGGAAYGAMEGLGPGVKGRLLGAAGYGAAGALGGAIGGTLNRAQDEQNRRIAYRVRPKDFESD